MENKLPADIQQGVEDCVKYCIQNQNHLTPHIAVRSAVEVWAQKVAALRARCERMERALNWYADDGNYLGDNGELSTAYKNKMPNKAREALGHLSEPDYPKLTPEQIQERKEAIEWIRNPGGMRWVRASERLPSTRLEVIVRNFNTGKVQKTKNLGHNKGWDVGMDREFMWTNTEWLDEGKEVEND